MRRSVISPMPVSSRSDYCSLSPLFLSPRQRAGLFFRSHGPSGGQVEPRAQNRNTKKPKISQYPIKTTDPIRELGRAIAASAGKARKNPKETSCAPSRNVISENVENARHGDRNLRQRRPKTKATAMTTQSEFGAWNT